LRALIEIDEQLRRERRGRSSFLLVVCARVDRNADATAIADERGNSRHLTGSGVQARVFLV